MTRRTLFLILLAGFLIAAAIIGLFLYRSGSSFAPNTYTEQFERMDADSLREIVQNATTVLERKDSTTVASLEAIGVLKDSLLVIAGKIEAYMNVTTDTELRNQLRITHVKTRELIANCRQIIMDGALQLLQPTNLALRNLIKEIKDQTEVLRNTARTVGTVADIVSAITAILSAPVLAPVSTPPTGS